MKKVIVISLGGSIIIPNEVDVTASRAASTLNFQGKMQEISGFKFLDGFKKVLKKHYKTYRFVLVCGGGSIARKYINALRLEGKSELELSHAGIMATRMNAKFVMQFFGKDANKTLPEDMVHVENEMNKNNVVVCGALRYTPNSTSDGTAAKLASFLGADFINMTNVAGLYSADPRKHRDAKFIPFQTWKEFEERALAIKFKNGQHFVLDQSAAVFIREHKIKTSIVGPDLKNFDRLLKGEKFIGTVIEG